MPKSEPFVRSVDGTEIFAAQQGAGRPIVIVHGGLSEAAHWDPVSSRLAQVYRIVGVERRLYGRSGPPQSSHSIAREAEDIAAVLAKIGEPAILVGHSSGGVVSLEAARQRPPQLAGLVLYEPPVQTDTPIGGAAQGEAEAALAAGDADRALQIFFDRMVGLPETEVARMRAPMWRAGWGDMMKRLPAQLEDNRAIRALPLGVERYRTIDTPTRLLRGTESPEHLKQRLAALAPVLPNARVIDLPGQGHVANLTGPDLLAAAILEFAAEVFS